MKKMNKTRVQNVIGFVKKAPVAGRSYTDMLKHVVKSELGKKYDYSSADRGLLGGSYIEELNCRGVIKDYVDGRYYFEG